MSTYLSNQQYESYLPVYDTVPESWEEGRQFLVETLKKISNAVNIREIGWFLQEEQLLSGKQFSNGIIQNSNAFRSVFRMVVNFGTLPNNSSKSVAHGINVNGNFSLVALWISCTDPINLNSFTCSTWANSGSNPIILNIQGSNVVVTTNSDYTLYTICYVVIEYLLEV